MKIKILVKLGELILGKAFSDEEPRADMFLPVWLLAFGLLLLVGGVAFGICAAVFLSGACVLGAVFCLVLGVAALLCWRNQTIRMLSDDSFEYTTFLGNKKVYRFDDITGLRNNKDSLTLFVGKDKVHIESSAILTKRFVERLNRRLSGSSGDEADRLSGSPGDEAPSD